MPHMLHPTCYSYIKSTQSYFRGGSSDSCHAAGAHAIYGGTGAFFRKPGKYGRGSAESKALITFLGCGPPYILLYHVGLNLRISAEKLANDLHHHVIGAGMPKKSFFSSPAVSCANAID